MGGCLDDRKEKLIEDIIDSPRSYPLNDKDIAELERLSIGELQQRLTNNKSPEAIFEM